jgi:hypothetical protein
MTGRPNWARGLTAQTDERIAKNAAARRGKTRGAIKSRPREAMEQPPVITSPSQALRVDQYEHYVYLLGLYLGDGCLVRYPSTYRLEIYLDPKYPGVIESCARAMRTIHVNGRANVRPKGSEVVVNSYGRWWLPLFPQHGPGRKHLRPIVLAEWQNELVRQYPWRFLRGCLDSEGYRSRRIVGGRNYPFYGFKNESLDIRRMFELTCQRLAIRYTVPAYNIVSIARRPEVALLDSLMFTKS